MKALLFLGGIAIGAALSWSAGVVYGTKASAKAVKAELAECRESSELNADALDKTQTTLEQARDEASSATEKGNAAAARLETCERSNANLQSLADLRAAEIGRLANAASTSELREETPPDDSWKLVGVQPFDWTDEPPTKAEYMLAAKRMIAACTPWPLIYGEPITDQVTIARTLAEYVESFRHMMDEPPTRIKPMTVLCRREQTRFAVRYTERFIEHDRMLDDEELFVKAVTEPIPTVQTAGPPNPPKKSKK